MVGSAANSSTAKTVFPWAAVILLAAVPLLFDGSYLRHLFIIAMIYAVVASSWDLSLGYGGLFNFAHLTFFGVGAYGSAILSKVVGLPPLFTVPAGGLVAILAAVVVFVPIQRLRGIYIILVTFAFTQLVSQIVISQAEITGGSIGMTFLPPIEIFGYNLARDGKFGYFYLALALLVASTVCLRRFVTSATGLALVALRDNEDYAVVRGVSRARTHLLTLVTSAAFTGIAGGLYATYLRTASPNVFGFDLLALVLSMLLVGGSGTLFGAVMAAFLLTFVSEAMAGLGAWRHLIISAMIVVVMLFYPGGLFAAVSALWDRLSRLAGANQPNEANTKGNVP